MEFVLIVYTFSVSGTGELAMTSLVTPLLRTEVHEDVRKMVWTRLSIPEQPEHKTAAGSLQDH